MSNFVLSKEQIKLNASVKNKSEAIALAGDLLVQGQYVTKEYIDKMQDREALSTTYIGNGVAIPHGTNESKAFIKSSGISIVQIPEGVDFGGGNMAYLLIGIAGVGDEHLEMLSSIAIVCSEEENVKKLVQATRDEEVIAILKGGL
ncbi:PTS sugar transporter subunit IIA [Anaerosinus massiliensis]|uniref:PTS sugar transporter subunit IIA n=1 Tax=Massilibacillus massiliensis TaxID=1806837 RepID=UPI000B1291A7|nr:PTS sugar transporter subunit IIA [Massilibacillus massiliensis]